MQYGIEDFIYGFTQDVLLPQFVEWTWAISLVLLGTLFYQCTSRWRGGRYVTAIICGFVALASFRFHLLSILFLVDKAEDGPIAGELFSPNPQHLGIFLGALFVAVTSFSLLAGWFTAAPQVEE